MREFTIVLFIIIALIILFLLFIWNVVFGKSLRKMIFTMLGVWQDKNRLADPDAPIIPNQEKYASQVLEERAAMAKQQVALEAPKKPQIAQLPSEDDADDTSDNGWPRELDYETRHEPHPFRHVHLETDTEKTHEIMDVDTYNPPENESDSQAQ